MSAAVRDVRTILAVTNLRKDKTRGRREMSVETLGRSVARSVVFAAALSVAIFIIFSIMDNGHISKNHAAIVWIPIFVSAVASAARSYLFIRQLPNPEPTSLSGPKGESDA